jgi:hypothetical protein
LLEMPWTRKGWRLLVFDDSSRVHHYFYSLIQCHLKWYERFLSQIIYYTWTGRGTSWFGRLYSGSSE